MDAYAFPQARQRREAEKDQKRRAHRAAELEQNMRDKEEQKRRQQQEVQELMVRAACLLVIASADPIAAVYDADRPGLLSLSCPALYARNMPTLTTNSDC